jgi:DNA-binding transcriptional LysR family regulator
LQRKPASDLHSTLFVRKGHPALRQKRLSRKHVADYDLVSPSDSRPYGAALRAIYEDHGVDWRKRMHVIDFFPIVRSIVANSDSIGVVALSETKAPGFQERFAVLHIPGMFKREPMCCATRGRWQPSPAARAFIRAVQTHS